MLCLASVEEAELDDISCTDTERQWGPLKAATLKEYAAKKFPDMCHVKGQRDVYVNNLPAVTEEMKDRWNLKLMNSFALGEFSLFMSNLRKGQGLAASDEDAACLNEERLLLFKRLLSFRSFRTLGKIRRMTEEQVLKLSAVHKAFYDQYVVSTLERSVDMCCADQGTKEWKSSRKLRITASKGRAQFTYYSNKKPDWDARFTSVYLQPFEGNEETDRGLADEIMCRDKYATKTKCRVLECGALVRPEVPWLAASPDGIVLDDNGNFLRSIEIKSFKEGTRLTSYELFLMNAIPTIDSNGNVKVRTQHYAQMQLGMLVTGMSECDYCPYTSVDDDFQHVRVPFDEEHVFELCAILVKVYFEEFLPRMVAHYNFCIDDMDGNDDTSDDD